MAIVQISKIQHRTGANIDLPQLDVGEIGFASDERKIYIGNDPILYPPVGDGTTQTELLTDASPLSFNQLTGTNNTAISISTTAPGELLVAQEVEGVITWVNGGGNTGVNIDLGNASNVNLQGGFNGAVLQSDGMGNLSWVTNGVVQYHIASISQADPGVLATTTTNYIPTGAAVTITGITGLGGASFVNGGYNSTNMYYVIRQNDGSLKLYEDSAFTTPVDTSGFLPYVATTGLVTTMVQAHGAASAGGGNTQVQFNDGGSTLNGTGNLTYNKTTNVLNMTGNIVVASLIGNSYGYFNGPIGNTTPNTGKFTSTFVGNTTANVLVTGGNVIATTKITADIVYASHNGDGTNFQVGDDAWIGDINATNTLVIKGQQDPTKGYVVFGNANASSTLGRSGTGPLTYNGNFTANGNVTANAIHLGTWSIFANTDGIFANNGSHTFSIGLTQI